MESDKKETKEWGSDGAKILFSIQRLLDRFQLFLGFCVKKGCCCVRKCLKSRKMVEEECTHINAVMVIKQQLRSKVNFRQ